MLWMVVPLKRFADFAGRSRRLEFWSFSLLTTGLILLAHYGDNLRSMPKIWSGMGPLELVTTAMLLLPSLAVSVRRLHDSGRSGLWTLVLYVPFAATMATGNWSETAQLVIATALILGALIWFALMVQPGMPGSNEYGLSPKGGIA
jgi:uncharacterized membrane protein YhaH (DUF805 family)